MSERAGEPAVRLEPVTPAHAERMLAWMHDPAVAENLGVRGAPSRERTIGWIERASADDATHPFAILLDGEHVGNVVLDQLDRHLGTARLSIYVGEARARGRGVGHRAVHLVLAHAFDALGLHKVWLTVHARNAAAIAAYVRVGFVVEGVHRDEFLLGGVRLPALYMGVLRPDFDAARRPPPAPPAS